VLPKVRAGLLSVVVPTLNEELRIEQTLGRVIGDPDVEVIVADGGSHDATTDIARRMGATVVSANAGRGRQMNAGAAVSSGDTLLFLHADTLVPAAFHASIRSTLDRGAIAGAFKLRIDSDRWGLRWIERGVDIRSRYLQRPYGDQGIFVSSESFFRLGGFPNWPLMEDYEFCRRLRKHGKIALAPSRVTTSARRWSKLGLWRTTLLNQVCVAGFCLGVSPERLAQWYRTR
jgi:hypothetical protein